MKTITIFSQYQKNLQFTFWVKYADAYQQYTQLPLPYRGLQLAFVQVITPWGDIFTY